MAYLRTRRVRSLPSECGLYINSALREWSSSNNAERRVANIQPDGSLKRQQLNAAATIMYFVIEAGRQQINKHDNHSIRAAFRKTFEALQELVANAVYKYRIRTVPLND